MADSSKDQKAVKPNVFVRIGLFIKQIIDELRKVVTPTRKQLFFWSLAVFIFVFLMMALVMGLDGLFGDLVIRIFG
ncbi:MAG: preprotein translocase subunit SecE [Bifidobacteriaceae bacterium]|nr:preprotein translocase subunit SecE [Bifidobacteriaceae bacterium]